MAGGQRGKFEARTEGNKEGKQLLVWLPLDQTVEQIHDSDFCLQMCQVLNTGQHQLDSLDLLYPTLFPWESGGRGQGPLMRSYFPRYIVSRSAGVNRERSGWPGVNTPNSSIDLDPNQRPSLLHTGPPTSCFQETFSSWKTLDSRKISIPRGRVWGVLN